jgi:hypothetical protein
MENAAPLSDCPFLHPAGVVCTAALAPRIPPRAVRVAACRGGDHEDCATFLARLLSAPRPARPRRR